MTARILVDSSFLYALYDLDDKYHQDAVLFVASDKSQRILVDVALAEVTHLLKRSVGQQSVLLFLDRVIEPPLYIEHISSDDLRRAQEIMATYATANFDLADCCLMALSERLNITQVCTFDRRDFDIFRPRHCTYLETLP